MNDEDANLRRRALAAYFRSGGDFQPSSASGVQIVGGKKYVLLAAGGKVLAVYRVENIGRLKRLRRWPKELERLA